MEKTLPQPLKPIDLVKPCKEGDIVEGTVIGIGRSALYLDLGPQGTGIIYGKAFMEEKDALKDITVGNTLSMKIVSLENDDGYIELSFREAGRQMAWAKLRELKDSGDMVTVSVQGANKGGLLSELFGVQAFLPVSQLSPDHYPKVEGGDTSRILKALQDFIGQDLAVQVLDFNKEEEKVILSERSKEKGRIQELASQYALGDVVEGEVTGVVDFGAFMKFGKEDEAIEGLIHISEIDWQIIDNPSEFLKQGDRVQAKIIDIAQGKISLSLKALKEDPWKLIVEKYKKEDIVKGNVTKLNPFGAFVEIEPKIQGLCHISEFGTRETMESKLNPGEEYSFQILEITPAEHRMSLRLLEGTGTKK
ncbi:MAG: S1 RNA-binding domain-containing protein [bacterium]|nr:S1 RNA-binding domain-containing protein [bacterium]